MPVSISTGFFMTIKERYKYIIDYFLEHAPEAETELVYDNPFQLLVAVILSAQCTDVRINKTTPAIFAKFPDAKSMSNATFEDIFALIRSISYPNNKARHLLGMSKLLEEKYAGEVPMTVNELIELPGVGRKTANVVTSVIDEQPNMAVDTHVFRVSARIGLTVGAKTPTAAEKQLIKHLPSEYVHKAHHWIILHGRYICMARKPKCNSCGLTKVCKFYKKYEFDYAKSQ
jgi:endonuclease III